MSEPKPSSKRQFMGPVPKPYIPKKKRVASETEYKPILQQKIQWKELEVEENLKQYAKQQFTVKSKIPTDVDSVLSGHDGAITALRWHPVYGHLLVSSSLDSSVRLWSVYPNKGEVLNLRHTQGVKDIRWSVDGCTLFSGGLDCYVNVIDTEKGVCSHSYKHTEWVTSLCAHPTNPSLFLSGGHQKGIVCWDTRVGSVVCEYFAEFGEVEDMTFLDKNGNSFLSSAEITKRNSTDKGLIVWDFRSGAPLSNQIYLETYTCSCVRKHPTEEVFVAQSAADYLALFQSTKPYRLNRTKRYGGHKVSGYKIGFSFSPDGEIIVTGSTGGSLYFYDYHTSRILDVMRAFNKCACMCAEYHPRLSSAIAIGSWDGKIAVLK
ncbi:hypothetical protein WA171_000867 [Blastocystis sp. BT1]